MSGNPGNGIKYHIYENLKHTPAEHGSSLKAIHVTREWGKRLVVTEISADCVRTPKRVIRGDTERDHNPMMWKKVGSDHTKKVYEPWEGEYHVYF